MTMLLTGCGLAGLSKFSQIDGMHDLSVAAARVFTGGCRTLTASDKSCFVGTTRITTRTAGVDFWLEFWFKPNNFTIDQVVFSDGGLGNRGISIWPTTSTGTISCSFDSGDGTRLNNHTTGVVVAGEWNHVLLTANRNGGGATGLTVYVNGAAGETFDISALDAKDISGRSGSYWPCVGSYASGTQFYFGGSIAHVRYGEGYVPTASDATWMYNGKNGRTLADYVELGGSLYSSLKRNYECNETDPTANLVDQLDLPGDGSNDLVRTHAELLSNTGFETRAGITGANFTAGDHTCLSIADGSQTGLDPLTGSFSLVFMFKITSLPATAAILYDKFSGSTGYSAYITSTGTIVLQFGDGTGALSSESISTVTTGVWYSCIVTYDRSGYAKLYIGAASITEYCSIDISAKTASINSTNGFGIGCYASPIAYWFSGVMAMVGYADELLTEADRTEYHNSRLGKYYNELSAGLKAKFVSFWDLTDGPYTATQTANDFVGTNDLSFSAAELVTNGDFSTGDLTGWTNGNMTTWEYSDGELHAASDGDPAYQEGGRVALHLTNGRTYTASVKHTHVSGSAMYATITPTIGGTSGSVGFQELLNSDGTTTKTFTCTETDTDNWWNFVGYYTDASDWKFDDISVKAASIPLVSDADLFGSWTESTASGNSQVAVYTLSPQAGALSCRLVENAAGTAASIAQDILTVGNEYTYSMQSHGSAAGKTYTVYCGTTTAAETADTGSFGAETGTLTCAGSATFKIESTDAASSSIYLDTISVKATRIAVGNGPAEAIAEDSVGTNHGTLTGFTPADLIKAWTTDTHNGEGYAITFDGVGNYLPLPTVAGNHATMSMWFYTGSPFSKTTGFKPLYGNSTGEHPSVLLGNVTGSISDETLSLFSDGTHLTYITDDISIGWHHLCFSWNGTHYDVYLDGIKRIVNAYSGGGHAAQIANLAWDLAAYNSHTSFGAFKLDDLRIYNVALTPAQVAELYTLAEDEEVTGATAVAQWRFDDGPFGQPADGDPVLGLLAKDGTALFQQSTAAQRPTYARSVALLNNQPAIRFTKASVQYLDYAGGLLTAGSGYIAFVIAIPAGGDVTTKQSIFCSADEGTASYYLDVYIESGVWKVAQKNNDAEVISVTSTTACAANAAYFVEIESDGTTVTVRINNVAQTLSNATQDWFGDTTLRDNFTLGVKKTSSESGPFDHYLAAIELLDRQPTTTEKALIRSLSHRTYGVP